jgi:hypothetical protein
MCSVFASSQSNFTGRGMYDLIVYTIGHAESPGWEQGSLWAVARSVWRTLVLQSRGDAPSALVGKMAAQVTAIVKDAENVDPLPTTAVDDEVPWIVNKTQGCTCACAAEAQMVRPDTRQQVASVLRAGPLRVLLDVSERLHEQIFIAQCRVCSELSFTPSEGFLEIGADFRGKDKFRR